MEDEPDGGPPPRPDSLLPYDGWMEEAARLVVVRALAHVGAHGLPGDHHFYISFRTDAPGVVMPQRLRAQYPQEMTVVVQHQFWDLQVDPDEGWFGVGLSFGGVPSMLTVPFTALTAFADPQVQFGLRFRVAEPPANDEPAAAAAPEPAAPRLEALGPEEPREEPQVVSLDAFRRKTPHKD